MILSRNNARNRVTALTAVLTLAFLVAPSSTHADSPAQATAVLPSIACLGTGSVHYTPGLRFTRALVSGAVDYRYRSCLVVGQRGVTSGGFQRVHTLPESCEDLTMDAPPYEYHMPINWNDKTTSVASVSVDRDPRIPVVAFKLTGTVVSGHFTGNDLNMTIAFLNTPADLSACNSRDGLTSLSGLIWLALTPPKS